MSGGGPVSVCLDLSPSHGGMYRGVIDIAEMLNTPIVTFHDGTGILPPKPFGLRITQIDCTGVSKLAQVMRLPRGVREAAISAINGAGVVVAHSLFRAHAMVIHQYSKATGVPYVVVPHGALAPELWQTQRIGRWAWLLAGGRRYLSDAATVVFATAGEMESAVETLGWQPRSIVIPFPVELGPAPHSEQRQQEARRTLGLPMQGRVFLVLGRLDPVKRPGQIIQAFLEAELNEGVLVFAGGDGRERADDLRALVPTVARSRVFFLGYLDSVAKADAFAASDAYVSWSAHESFGYAAAESMASGLPVILPPTHPLAGAIQAMNCGLVTPSAERHALVVAIKTFASWNLLEMRNRGQAARQWAGSQWARAAVRERWNQLLAAVTQS